MLKVRKFHFTTIVLTRKGTSYQDLYTKKGSMF